MTRPVVVGGGGGGGGGAWVVVAVGTSGLPPCTMARGSAFATGAVEAEAVASMGSTG